jgi:hypothetical protein
MGNPVDQTGSFSPFECGPDDDNPLFQAVMPKARTESVYKSGKVLWEEVFGPRGLATDGIQKVLTAFLVFVHGPLV